MTSRATSSANTPSRIGAAWFIMGLCLLALGLMNIKQGIIEFRLRLMSADVMRDISQGNDAETTVAFLASLAGPYPDNSVMGETVYQMANFLSLSSDDPEPLFERFDLISRGEDQLRRTPTDAFTWLNHAQAAALAFEPTVERDPAMEAFRLSVLYGAYELQLFVPRSLFCVFYGDEMPDRYYKICEQQLAVFEETARADYQQFESAYINAPLP